MKLLMRPLLLSLLALFLSVGIVQAEKYVFNDNIIYWDGYSSSIAAWNIDDSVGDNPLLDGMNVYINGGYLTKVEIIFNDSSYSNPERITYDSLFINSDWDAIADDWESWDYYVKGFISSFGDYKVNDPYQYDIATQNNYRKDHPVGFISGLENDSFLSSLNYNSTENILSYIFLDEKILIAQGFAIGYTPYCANDVLLAKAPVPEPATMMLLGIGMISLAGVSRKTLFKK